MLSPWSNLGLSGLHKHTTVIGYVSPLMGLKISTFWSPTKLYNLFHENRSFSHLNLHKHKGSFFLDYNYRFPAVFFLSNIPRE